MEQLLKQIEDHKKEIAAYIAADAKVAEESRIKYLGTRGIVKAIMGEMKNVAPENKKEAGQLLNEFKLFTESKFEELKNATSTSRDQQASGMDLHCREMISHWPRHPVTLDAQQDCFIFSDWVLQ